MTIQDEEFNGIQGVKFIIEDTGIGIAKDKMDRLFKPFSQVDSSTTKKYGGTGLGLILAKKFCEVLEGVIAYSSTLGKGSVFSVWIPITKTDQLKFPEL
jgi:signal transduction histidine kinase